VLWIGRHRFNADPNPDLTFHVDADSDPVSDWQQNNANPHAKPNPVSTLVEK
jgi:hypothetical protein